MFKHSFYLLFSILISCNAQDKRPLIGETNYQQELNAFYKDASKSPLKKSDLKKFSGLDFFPVDSTFIVVATIKRIENAPVFEMPTTTDRKPLYKAYGTLHFKLKDIASQLTLYQSQDEAKDSEYADYLFLPFTDYTSGNSSYGGGRYMDVMLSDIDSNNAVLLNFNNTYNPYCAYNKKFSCPLTPRENHLNMEVTAGIKDYKK